MDGILYIGFMTVVLIAFGLMIHRTKDEDLKEQDF